MSASVRTEYEISCTHSNCDDDDDGDEIPAQLLEAKEECKEKNEDEIGRLAHGVEGEGDAFEG